SALDPELVGEVLQVIKSLSESDITMLIVTHEMNFAKQVADRIIFMENGTIVEDYSPDQLFKSSKNSRISQFANINANEYA
ncbi:MAG: amino acid ABC transporter ATP-binding protein, partial [Paraclostridium sp.]